MGQTEKYNLPYPSEDDYLKDTAEFIKNLAESTETTMETLENKKLDKTSKATSTEAIAGTNNTKYTTPASVKSAIDKALEGYTPSGGGEKEVGYADETLEGTEVILIEESDFAGENSIELAKVEQNLSSNSEKTVPSVKAVNDGIKTNIITGQEVATNEYLDGKRVYKRNISAIGENSSGTTLTLSNINFDFSEIWIDESDSFISNENETLSINWYFAAEDYCRVWIGKNTKIIRYRTGGNLSGRTFNVMLKYTKNT